MAKFSEALWLSIVILVVAMAARAQRSDELIELDPAVNNIVPVDVHVEKLADHVGFPSEGPVWVRNGGYLLFSNIPANVIDKWTPEGRISGYLKPSGFTGTDASGLHLIGSNGITLDREGRVVFCASGDRAIVRIEKNGHHTVLADRYDGKRLNSPNDLVYKSDGALYFTDPSSGLLGRDKSPLKELPFDGVFLLKDGKLQVIDKSFTLPNGIAVSPNAKTLYIADTRKMAIMRFDIQPDDTIANGHLFMYMGPDKGVGHPDGMKVDKIGNVYSTGPGGLWIVSPDGKHLGTIKTSFLLTNLAFGDADGKTLFMTTRTGELLKVRLKVDGARP